MKKLIMAAALFSAVYTGFTTAKEVQASDVESAIVHRQGTYKVVGGHMGSLQAILFMGREGDAVYHAEGIKSAWEHMGKSFPAGSDKGKTRALPAIWENMDDFGAKGKAAYAATVKLVEATKSGDQGASVEAFKELGGACKACHKDYRAK